MKSGQTGTNRMLSWLQVCLAWCGVQQEVQENADPQRGAGCNHRIIEGLKKNYNSSPRLPLKRRTVHMVDSRHYIHPVNGE